MAKELFDILTFNTAKASGITDIGTTLQEVVSLTTPVLDPGMYIVSYSFQLDFYEDRNKPMFFQVGGTFGQATEFSETISDATGAGHKIRAYSYPKEWGGGVVEISLSMRRNVNMTVLDCDFVDVSIQRVG